MNKLMKRTFLKTFLKEFHQIVLEDVIRHMEERIEI